MKKSIWIELDVIPNSHKWVLIEIEKYCINEKLDYEIIEANEEPIVRIDNKLYKCKIQYGGRIPSTIHCVEI